jgi:hypothetical protein
MTKSLATYRPPEFVELARVDLTPDELEVLSIYTEGGGYPLAPATAVKFFELFINGSSAAEIHRLNPAFPVGAILDSQVRYKWAAERDRCAVELQQRVRESVIKAQLETTELMADMLRAAKRQHGDKLKKFIQSGNEKDLDGVLNIESLHSLGKIVDSLLKITGQDRVSKVKTENTQNLNVNLTSSQSNEDLSPEEAAKVLEILADAKRRKNVPEPKD